MTSPQTAAGSTTGPHDAQPVRSYGPKLGEAAATVVLIHGRGATADGMFILADALGVSDVSYLAPQAAGNTWYPFSFLAPLQRNEPGLSSGLRKIGAIIRQTAEANVLPERTVILGFSQGACLALEYVARNPRRLGGVVGLSGGLIGTAEHQGQSPPRDKVFDYKGSLRGTPVFLGCSDIDPHIPVERVHQSAEVFERLQASVTRRVYPGFGHAINDDEITYVRELISGIVASG